MGSSVTTPPIQLPVSIAQGGTNATSFAVANSFVKYDGTRLTATGAVAPITRLIVGEAWALGLGIVIATGDGNCIVSNVQNLGVVVEQLPDAFANLGRILIFKDTDGSCAAGGSLVITPLGTDTIDGNLTETINRAFDCRIIASVRTSNTTATWAILGKMP